MMKMNFTTNKTSSSGVQTTTLISQSTSAVTSAKSSITAPNSMLHNVMTARSGCKSCGK